MNRAGGSAEEQRLRDEVRELREDLRRLTLRVDRQGDLLAEVSDSVAASSAAPIVSVQVALRRSAVLRQGFHEPKSLWSLIQQGLLTGKSTETQWLEKSADF